MGRLCRKSEQNSKQPVSSQCIFSKGQSYFSRTIRKFWGENYGHGKGWTISFFTTIIFNAHVRAKNQTFPIVDKNVLPVTDGKEFGLK